MKIKCCFDKLSDIKNENVSRWLKSEHIRPGGLMIGEERQVYGMVFWNGAPMYYICNEQNDEYPIPTYSGFYKVIDPRFSQYWMLRINISDDGVHIPELVFKEWCEEDLFYEKLLDGEEREEAVFARYKKLMDKEHEPSNTGPIGTRIWQFIDDETDMSDFENWLYDTNSTKDLERIMPADLYMKLISFDYKNIDESELPKLRSELKLWIKSAIS